MKTTRQRFKEDLKKLVSEVSTSGAAGAYNTPYAFNPNKNAKGAARNYYLKLGWKLVDQNKLRKKVKGIDHKDLWK